MDRALGTGAIAEALRAAGCAVEIHDQHFPQAAKDTEWLPDDQARPCVAAHLATQKRASFDHVFVDEAQDVSVA